MIYIVSVSGGLTSYEALRRTIDRHGHAAVRAVFADTLVEDADLYRFLGDIERHLEIPITRLADGRTPFDVWHDVRAITLPHGQSAGAAPCSRLLKREVLTAWIAEQPTPHTLVFGMDWSEPHRMETVRRRWSPTPVWFPLAEPPYVDKCHIADALNRAGIETPRLYAEGFAHNNCGGACVLAGQAHWALLYHQRPETYARWEAEEERLRKHLGKDVSILKDRRGGNRAKPMTLAAFRERLERGEAYATLEWGGCGCFAGTEQEAMPFLQDVEPKKEA